MRLYRIASWTCTLILAVAFVFIGASKLAGTSAVRWNERFSHWGFPSGARHVVGVIEVAAGIGLLVPATRRAAAAALVTTMIGALGTHLASGELWRIIPPVTLGALTLLVYVSGTKRVGTDESEDREPERQTDSVG